MVWRKADKPNLRTGSAPAPKKTPRSYESYPEGSTAKGSAPTASAGKGSRSHKGIGAKNQDGRAKM